jgi:hypothetical protein
MSDDGWWDDYSYSRALVMSETDPEVKASLALCYGINLEEGKVMNNGHIHLRQELYTVDNCGEGDVGTITIRSTIDDTASLIMSTAMAEDLAVQLERRARYNRDAAKARG